MRPILMLSLAGALVLSPSCISNRYKARATERISVSYEPAGGIDVSTRNGSIDILGSGAGDEIQIEAKIVATGSSQEEADERLSQVKIRCDRDPNSSRLILRASFGDKPRGSDGVSYTVRLPDADGARLSTSNGRIRVEAIHGSLDAATSNGRVEVKDHDGKVKVRTSNGSVVLTEIAGPVEAKSSNGKIGVQLQPGAEGPIDVKTSNGSINLAVGEAFAGTMSLNTSNGRVRMNGKADHAKCRLKKRSGTIQFSEAGRASRARTSNGSITVSVIE